MRQGEITEEMRAEMARRYPAGEGCPEIARDLGCSAQTVRYHLKEMGIPLRSPREAAAQRRDPIAEQISAERLNELYWGPNSGYPSLCELGRVLGLTEMVVRKRMLRLGIKLRTMSEQIAIEHRRGRINWGGKPYRKGNAANFGERSGSKLGVHKSREWIEKIRRTRAVLYPRPTRPCAWCGTTFAKQRPDQVACCKSHGCLWRWWKRDDSQPRPLILSQLLERLETQPYKLLPRTRQTLQKAGADIDAGEGEYRAVERMWNQQWERARETAKRSPSRRSRPTMQPEAVGAVGAALLKAQREADGRS